MVKVYPCHDLRPVDELCKLEAGQSARVVPTRAVLWAFFELTAGVADNPGAAAQGERLCAQRIVFDLRVDLED
jgi:hypothetical protein